MKIVITGTTGLVGGALHKEFVGQGHQVVALTRSDFQKGSSGLSGLIQGADAVIHLAGAPVIKRWTDDYKQLILESRVHTTRLLSQAIGMATNRPPVFLCASAVGIYQPGLPSDELNTAIGSDFLADVCRQWEAAASEVPATTRLINLRFGVILDRSRGALATMLPPFRLGLGGKIGNGKQPFPWIHLADVVSGIDFLMHSSLSGPFNMVAPVLIDNEGLTRALSEVLRRPAIIPVPAFALRLLYGEGASTLLQAAVVAPRRLIGAGFQFQFPEIKGALTDLLK